MRELQTKELFLKEATSIFLPFLYDFEYPWLCLDKIEEIICALGDTLGQDYEKRDGNVWVARDACVAKSAVIENFTIIDKGAQIRHGAFIRGRAIIGKGAVVGNSTEIKNAVLFDKAQAPHYNYVGDSILGYCAHMGAGSITSNLKGDKSQVKIRSKGEIIHTGRRKIGAFIGDFGEIGCGCVLNPGTVVGAGAQIYPLCSVRGYVPKNSIYKDRDTVVKRRELCAE